MTRRVGEVLVARGKELFQKKRSKLQFAANAAADLLLNDLDAHPHAFVLACVMDRQVKAEKAWGIPYELSQRLGGFSMAFLAPLSDNEIRQAFTEPYPLHRFPEEMSHNLHLAIQRIASEFDGNAALIWSGHPSSAAVVLRFLAFRGVGPKIATMAANILARDFKIPFSDHYSVDVSVDVHLRRVFTRLGLISEGASVEEVVYTARALHPEFPGLMDLPAWEIGRSWCRPRNPRCSVCYMSSICPSARVEVGCAR